MKFKSAIMTQAAGSIGGITFTRNRFSQLVARARGKPVNPNTNNQNDIRTVLANSAIAWKKLTDIQRGLWIEYALGTPFVNSLGDSIVLTGIDMFCAVRGVIQTVFPKYDSVNFQLPPNLPGLLHRPIVEVTGPTVGTGFSVTITNPTDSVPMRYIVDISPRLSPGKYYYNGPWDPMARYFTTTIPPGGFVTDNIVTPAVGIRFFVLIRGWNYTPPHTISPQVMKAITSSIAV